jgi:hypothetical protein
MLVVQSTEICGLLDIQNVLGSNIRTMVSYHDNFKISSRITRRVLDGTYKMTTIVLYP